MIPESHGLILCQEYIGETDEETALGQAMFEEAERYLSSQPWALGILAIHVGILIPPVLGVLLVHAEVRGDADPWNWVIIGDLPPAYINIAAGATENAACALDCYVGAMGEWVSAVREGGSVDDLIPVNVPPTIEHAAMLASRLEFIDEQILIDYTAELGAEPGET